MKRKFWFFNDWKEAVIGLVLVIILLAWLSIPLFVLTSEPSGVYEYPPDENGCVKIEERREVWFFYDIREKVECP